MKQRNPIAVFLFGFITWGLYSWYWAVKTKGEMNKLGEKIPTAWIWLIPIIGFLWWNWKYSEGVEHVTKGKTSAVLAFVVLWLLGAIGQAIVQDSFNKVSDSTELAPVAAQPDAAAPMPETTVPTPEETPNTPVEAPTPSEETPPQAPIVSG